MIGMSRHTGAVIDGDGHLAQSITDILTTPRGTRVMRRDYGSDLPQLLDAPMNGETIVDVFAAVADALHRWEPRLRLKRVEITSAASGTFELVLEGETVAGAISVNTRLGGSV